MKIAYYAKSSSKSDDTEGHIKRAFEELGHEVVVVGYDEKIPECDFVLFHKQIPDTKHKKVCWYFDKIEWNNRENYIKECLNKTDYLFVTDKTWADKHPNNKLHVLRQGAGYTHRGLKLDTDAKIVFTGSLYNGRFSWANDVAKVFGNDFQVFGGTFNEDLNNLCATVPIFIAPQEPSDDNYWSSRVYLTLGSGGFLIHPKLKGLQEEYTDDELVTYETNDEMIKKINYYLNNPEERERIRINGWNKTINNYTYKHRVCSLIATLQEK